MSLSSASSSASSDDEENPLIPPVVIVINPLHALALNYGPTTLFVIALGIHAGVSIFEYWHDDFPKSRSGAVFWTNAALAVSSLLWFIALSVIFCRSLGRNQGAIFVCFLLVVLETIAAFFSVAMGNSAVVEGCGTPTK